MHFFSWVLRIGILRIQPNFKDMWLRQVDPKNRKSSVAGIAQLGERQTEDLKVACSIHAHRIFKLRLLPFWGYRKAIYARWPNTYVIT
ncbi:unnamed protein product [Dovyalis caffra]|uniref:Uncharacterized protein n=1 Tax=Dovyalis caffra TaxID=77055 RepID=A0AAV1RIJ9_9ROSI|nr:unnamed protein product [Dovyalis caffra]